MSRLASCSWKAGWFLEIFFPCSRIAIFYFCFSAFVACLLVFPGAAGALLDYNALFREIVKTASPCFSVFHAVYFIFSLNPDATIGILRRSIYSWIALNKSGAATSANREIICREWRTTLAPILTRMLPGVLRPMARNSL